MKTHVVSVHEGKNKFKCIICDYRFSLKVHMKLHVASVYEGKKHIQMHRL